MPPAAAPDEKSDELGMLHLPGDVIDHSTFEQILEMDDDSERDFSKSIVYDFFEQAESTFEKMADSLEKKDIEQLSTLGHFLKGSSATLGMTKVKDSCEKIQHLGARMDETGTTKEPDDAKTLAKLKTIVDQAEVEFREAEKTLRRFYEESDNA